MNLTEKDLEEFRRLWLEEFHEDISIDEARQHATRLLELYAVLARPLPQQAAKETESSSEPHEILPLLP